MDSSDADAVIKATTVESSDESVVTVTQPTSGSFDAAVTGEGTATIKLTSGNLTSTIAVTAAAPS